nr:hypothetical protein [Tanacetum cinerariifolium]
MIYYALWEVIENGATVLKTYVVKGVATFLHIITAEEMTQRRLEDFGQLELLDENLSHEDVNQTLLRSLSLEWNTHAVVWRNKADLDTISMDNLYNNLKVYKPEVKEMECRALTNLDNKNKKSSRRSVHVETPSSIALVSCNGLGGYDWSDQAEKGFNYQLMVFSSLNSDSKVSYDSTCSKSCLEIVKLLKSQNDKLLKDLKKSKLMVLGYKIGLKSIEEKLKLYKNESNYLEDTKVLKVEIYIGEISIREHKKKLKIVQKEKDGIQLNVEKFENSSKSLNKLIECLIVNNCKKSLGYENYNAVPPPYIGNFMPPTPNLSFTRTNEFINKPIVKNCKAMPSKEESKVVKKNDDT